MDGAVEWHVNFADPRLFTVYEEPLARKSHERDC